VRKAFTPLAELLARYAGDIARHARWINREVTPVWTEAVGPQAAAHLRPVQLRAGVLLVHADSSVWANWMRARQAELLKRLHGRAPLESLRQLSVRIVPTAGGVGTGNTATSRPKPRPLTGQARDAIKNTATTVADPGLRDALERLARIRGEEKE
jgi:hypothetical protein